MIKSQCRKLGLLVLSLMVSSAISGCGGGENPDQEFVQGLPSEQRVSGILVDILEPSGQLEIESNQASGQGRFLMTEPLSGIEVSHNFELEFELEEGGALSLYAFVRSDLSAGYELRFERHGSELRVFGRVGSIEDDWSSAFSQFDASGRVEMNIDIHNDEGDYGHLIFAVGSEPFLDPSNHPEFVGSPGSGRGQNWGFDLQGARLLFTRSLPPRFPH